MFSIDKKKKYSLKFNQGQDIIYNNINCLDIHDNIGVNDNCLSSDNNYVELANFGNGEPKFEINNGERSYIVKKLYVYQISEYY